MSVDRVKDYIQTRREYLSRIKTVIAKKLNLMLKEDEIDDDAALFGLGLGLDSIDVLDLVIGLEGEFQVKLPEDNSKIFRSINSLADHFLEKTKITE